MSSGEPESLEPALVCEVPGDGTRYVHNVLEVSGWARGLHSVRVMFAGTELEAALGPEDGGERGRPFTVRLAVEEAARGEQLLVLSGRGPRDTLRVERMLVAAPYRDAHPPSEEALARGEVTLATGPPELSGGAPVRPPVRIGGWCLAAAGIDRVQAVLDGARLYDLVFPLVRRDVWRAVGRRDALLSGFELMLDRAECPPGHHTLVVLATSGDGRTVGQAGEFTCEERPGAGAVGLPTPDRAELLTASPDAGALAQLLADADAAWARWAAPLVDGKRVVVLAPGEIPAEATLSALRQTAAEINVITDAEELNSLADGSAALVVVRSALALDDERLAGLERVLAADGTLVAAGDVETLGLLRARFPHVVAWQQTAELRTALVPGRDPSSARVITLAGRRPPPELLPTLPGSIAVDLSALELERALGRLTEVVAERHVLVSALEGDVVALYHRELQRASGELRAELSRREAELVTARERAAVAETELRALRRSSSWRLTAPLRALARASSRRRR